MSLSKSIVAEMLVHSGLRQVVFVLVDGPHDFFLQDFRAAVGAFGDAVEHDAEAVPGVVLGVEVAAEATDVVDEAGLGDHPAAQVGAAETIKQRAVLTRHRQAAQPGGGVAAEEIVRKNGDHRVGADRVLLGKSAAVVQGILIWGEFLVPREIH